MIGWEVAAVVLCLLLSAFFSSSETALTALSPIEARRRLEAGGWFTSSLELWVEHPLKVLTCILIGNNIVNITASALATDLATKLLEGDDAAIPVAIGAMTFLLLTFGEITPKTFAKARYRDLAGPMMWLLRVPYYLFFPATWCFVKLTKGLMRASGSQLDQGPQVTEEELEFLVDLGTREGSLEQGTATLLQSAFDYTSTVVRDVMIPRGEMVALDVSWDYDTVLEVFTESGHSRAPVYEETVDNIIGLFYAKDMLQLMNAREEFKLRQHMRDVAFVPEQKKISEQFADFKLKHVHMAVVVDEFGDIRGLVTLEDIIEEIFGEIQDEYDVEENHICEIRPGVIEVDARCPLPDLEKHIGYTFPEHPEYESLGGFIVTELGAVPEVGTKLTRDNLRFKVIDADAKRVIRVEVVDQRPLRTSQPMDASPRQLSRLASFVWPVGE